MARCWGAWPPPPRECSRDDEYRYRAIDWRAAASKRKLITRQNQLERKPVGRAHVASRAGVNVGLSLISRSLEVKVRHLP